MVSDFWLLLTGGLCCFRKHIIPLKVRTHVAPLLYKTITETEDLDQLLIRNFAKVLTSILKPKDGVLLSISLPWRPLYHLINNNYFGKARTPQTPLCRNLGSSLVSLARQARRYFKDEANEEIMSELRPLCCPQDMSILKAQGFMCLLLKRAIPTVMQYVTEAMGMWTWVVAYYDWDLLWTTLLSSIARHHYKMHAATWQPLVDPLFAHLLHVLDLPIGKALSAVVFRVGGLDLGLGIWDLGFGVSGLDFGVHVQVFRAGDSGGGCKRGGKARFERWVGQARRALASTRTAMRASVTRMVIHFSRCQSLCTRASRAARRRRLSRRPQSSSCKCQRYA